MVLTCLEEALCMNRVGLDRCFRFLRAGSRESLSYPEYGWLEVT